MTMTLDKGHMEPDVLLEKIFGKNALTKNSDGAERSSRMTMDTTKKLGTHGAGRSSIVFYTQEAFDT